jgi:hypothetical protein
MTSSTDPFEHLTVYTARRIRTMTDALPAAEAMAVANGRIVSVGTLARCLPPQHRRPLRRRRALAGVDRSPCASLAACGYHPVSHPGARRLDAAQRRVSRRHHTRRLYRPPEGALQPAQRLERAVHRLGLPSPLAWRSVSAPARCPLPRSAGGALAPLLP